MIPLSSPTAAARPFAVLLLAWDEAAPAVRAMLEAAQAPTPTQPALTVIVPAGPPTPESAATPTAAVSPPPTVFAAALAGAAPPTSAATPSLAASAVPPRLTLLSPVQSAPRDADNALPAPAQPRPAVHVLRLSSFSLADLAAHASQPLPAPVWTGAVAAPTAPYLGAITAPVGSPAVVLATSTPAAPAAQAATATSLQPGEALLTHADGPAPLAGAAGARISEEVEPAPLVPGYLPVPTFFLSPTEEPDAPLDSDFPATGPVASAIDSAPNPESATWTEALEALRIPAAAEAPTTSSAPANEAALAPGEEADAPTPPNHAVLGVPPPPPSAPDLNYQIIQYARFAVPVALAEQPFGVLYAPSWPTWLAAQELRQRTGRPLVLHLSALAAGTESAETATGWVAELQRQALRRADLVLVETYALASRLRRELSLPAHAVRVVSATDTAGVARALHRVQG